MHHSRDAHTQSLENYLKTLRKRAVWLRSIEGLLLSAAAFLGLLALSAGLSGPVATPLASFLWWALCILGPLLIFARTLWSLRRLGGTGAARLLARSHPALSPRLRGALELAHASSPQQSPQHSAALAAAHIAQVVDALDQHPPREVVPARGLLSRHVIASFLLLITCATLLSLHPALRTGLLSLLEPAKLGREGVLIAHVATDVRAKLLFPTYLGRAPEHLRDPQQITAPVGTTVEFSLKPRVDVTQVELLLPDRTASLRPVGQLFRGRFVVHESGTLIVHMRQGDQRYEDDKARAVVAQADHVPVVELLTPADEALVDPSAPLPIAFKAQDDKGIANVELVLQLAGGGSMKQTLWSARKAGKEEQSVEGQASVIPQSLGIRAGDRFEVWLEAQDGDAVSGPNTGQSRHVTLQTLSSARHLSEHLPHLKQVLDAGLVALADRLEAPLPPALEAARKRSQRLRQAGHAFTDAIEQFVLELDEQPAQSVAFDREQLRDMGERLRRLQRREAATHRRKSPSAEAIAQQDSTIVKELEADAILLSDLLSQAHVDEARALSDELQELRQRMQQLLTQLSESDSEQAKQDLLAELARAESRLRELQRSMAQMAAHVPSEFINQEAMEGQAASSSMQDLRTAIQQGDMEAAAEHLANLEEQLSSLSAELEEGGLRFRESRFGPRDKALMAAQERLAMLSEEQSRLTGRSAEKARQIMNRTPQTQMPDAQQLAEQAQRLDHQLQRLDRDSMGESEHALLDRAQQRIRDTMDSMGTGDLGEAARMASASERALDHMHRNLNADAQMFPGHDGQVAQNAAAAAAAHEAMERLSQSIEAALPRLSEHLKADDLKTMQQQAREQQRARKAAEDLQQAFENGPDGLPLAPEAKEALQQAADAMQRAERQLRSGDPQAANLAQEEATEQLRQLHEELAENRTQGQGGDRSGQGQARQGVDGKVDIPDGEDFEAPTQQRRRLLDAMREGTADGYEAAVRRYYQELLR